MYGGAPQQEGNSSGQDMSAALAAAMLAAAQEDEKKRQTYRYLEGLLPLILLVILGIFIAAKMGMIDLSFIPGFSKTIRVLILTDDPTAPDITSLINVLTYQYPRYQHIEVTKMALSPMRRIYASNLSDYKVVILYETKSKMLSLSQREELYKYVKNGGNLIVVLDSGTYMPKFDYYGTPGDTSPVWTGWKDKYMGAIMPVTCDTPTDCSLSSTGSARIATLTPEHPIMGGMEFYPETGAPLALHYIPGIVESANGTTIADVEIVNAAGGLSPNSTVKATYPGIVVSTNIMGGKVVFFNYEPQKTPIILINTIEWLG